MAAQPLLDIEAPVRTEVSPMWPWVLYSLTGFTGVLAEQGFEKYMSLLVGATAASSAVVISTYFLGFAIGSWIVAVLIRRGRVRFPLRTYGGIEFLVGASCVAFSYLFHPISGVLGPWQGLFSSELLKFAIRFCFGGILILPTAALMGASFPLIARVVDRGNESHGHFWLRAYALNLGGAVMAALSGAYLILPLFGIRGAFWICFAICTIVCAACMTLGRNENEKPLSTVEPGVREQAAPLDREAWVLLAGAFGSGFVFFALEVLWTHLIATAIGSSVYAFSAMLTSVLVGLLIAALRMDKIAVTRSPISYSRILQFSALLLVVQLRLWDWGQAFFLIHLPRALANFYGAEAFKLLLAGLLIVPSAAMLGSVYPCLLRSPLLEGPGRSYLTGYLNTWNSLGCLAGAIAGVFLLVPFLGAEWSLKVIIIGCLALGILFVWIETPSRKVLVRTALGVGLVLAYALVIHWDQRLLTSGINIYFGRQPDTTSDVSSPLHRKERIVFFEEDVQGGMTSVMEVQTVETGAREKVLLTNGKFEGTDSFPNQGQAQVAFAVIPSLFTRNFDRALLVGLGTGQSVLALARLGYRQLDVAEFAPGIIAASRAQYGELTQHALDLPNVSLHVEDGRNVLLSNPSRNYDLITVEITSVWFVGATNVYSREFYELARKRLRPGGAVQQWLQLHHTSPRELESIIATIRSVFPYVSCWYTGGQGMVVATVEPQLPPTDRATLLAGRVGSLIPGGPAERATVVRDMLQSNIVTPPGVDRLMRSIPAMINTDHNRWLEYATPKYNALGVNSVDANLAFLRSFKN